MDWRLNLLHGTITHTGKVIRLQFDNHHEATAAFETLRQLKMQQLDDRRAKEPAGMRRLKVMP